MVLTTKEVSYIIVVGIVISVLPISSTITALRRVIGPVFVATLLNLLVNQRIPFTEALLHVENFFYFRVMEQYLYYTDATIEYMKDYLEQIHCPTDVCILVQPIKFTKKVLGCLEEHRTLDKQKDQDSDPAWNNLSAAAKHSCVDEDQIQVKLQMAQNLVNELDFKFVKMQLRNHFSVNIRQLGNLLNLNSALAEKAMVDLQQAYRQWNCREAYFQIVQSKARKEVFQYRALNTISGKQCCDVDMPLTKAPIKRTMKIPQPEIKTLDDLAELCAMPKRELQNYIDWYFK